MNSIVTKTRTLFALGLYDVATVAAYRLLLRTGWHPVQRVRGELLSGPFFSGTSDEVDVISPDQVIMAAPLFGWLRPPQRSSLPDWHANQFKAVTSPITMLPWWRIGEFDEALGDIKGVWELSRFSWGIALAIRARAGDTRAIDTLDTWLADWCVHNPPYLGRNWKCGQEASIRVIRLATLALLLSQENSPSAAAKVFVETHLRRIAPTLGYARAQQNNHGTSEAAALFIGSSWLANSVGEEEGRRRLEERVLHLIAPDGSFSQHSVTYHRFMLETLSIVELWRRALQRRAFSEAYYTRVKQAAWWLKIMINSISGDAPNIGANDGAHFLSLGINDYRDFRPAAELAAALFSDEIPASVAGAHAVSLFGLKPRRPEVSAKSSQLFDDGGYAVLQAANAKVVMRYPRYKFRPSHADALHVDLWLKDKNWLRGPGSFSYAEPEREAFFSVVGHNTIQFDGHDQMPRLSRFLYGDWLKTDKRSALVEEDGVVRFEAAYRDAWKAYHCRVLKLSPTALRVEDHISGFKRDAVLRWHLRPENWALSGAVLRGPSMAITMSATSPLSISLADGWESRFYGRKEKAPVLEVRTCQGCVITSVIEW